jgi:hypothetical protein
MRRRAAPAPAPAIWRSSGPSLESARSSACGPRAFAKLPRADCFLKRFRFNPDPIDQLAIPFLIVLGILEPIAESFDPVQSCTQIWRI